MSILRDKRLEHAWSQVDLAEKAGVAIQTVSAYEQDPPRQLPKPSTVHKLAEALGVSPLVLNYLFHRQEVAA